MLQPYYPLTNYYWNAIRRCFPDSNGTNVTSYEYFVTCMCVVDMIYNTDVDIEPSTRLLYNITQLEITD